MEDASAPTHTRKRARSGTVTLMEKKLGLSAGKFKEDLEEAWRTVADKYGNDNLACDELREVLSLFGELPQISEEALPLLVHHLDTDGDDRIAFKDFMDGIKGWLAQEESDDDGGVGVEDDDDGGTNREDSVDREDSINPEDEDKGQLGSFVHFFTHFDRDGDGRLKRDELEELLDFLKEGKHIDADGDDSGQAHKEVVKVLNNQLTQAASHSEDGQITLDDFLNALRNISIALQDFSLNLPSQPTTPAANKPLTAPPASGDKEELARLRFDNTALLARQEQLERSLHQIGALNEKLTKERREQKEEIETAMKKIKNLQQHREKAKELSNQVESNKEELTRLRKTEAELTKLNAKLKAEAESLAGNRDTRDQRTRSEMEEMQYTISVQKEALAELEQSLEEKERTLSVVQEQNGQMAVALKKATQEAKDLGDAKSELDIQLSQYQLQLSTAQSEVATLREKVTKFEAERKLIAGTAAAVAARPPSLQAEFEALRSKEQVADEERLKREAEEREQKQHAEKAREERELKLQQNQMKEVEARKALETQMRREQEEREKKDREREQREQAAAEERERERATWQRSLEEKEAQIAHLTEELRRKEQDRLDREMKWMLEQQQAEAKLKELTEQQQVAQSDDSNELQALRGVIENAKNERKKLRLRNRQLDDDMKRLVQELRQTEDRYERLRHAMVQTSSNRSGGFFASLFSCCLPVQSNSPFPIDGGSGLALPETTGEGDQELRMMKTTSSKRRSSLVMSPKRPLIQSGEDDDDELEPVHGAGVGLMPARTRSLLSRVEDSSSGSSSGAVTPDSSEAEEH